MVKFGDAGLQFRVSRVRVRDKVRLGLASRVSSVTDRIGLAMVLRLAHFTFCQISIRKIPHPRTPAFYP